MADTTDVGVTNSWKLEVTSSANGTNAILTARPYALEWARTTSTPTASAVAHILEPNKDKDLTLKNGEKIYVRLPQEVTTPRLVKTVT